MDARTADAVPGSPAKTERVEGLRERKKRLLRQQLSDTATDMFVHRGFDAVRVAEVAEACGVSEKTVFNYFPTKESLLLDPLDATMAALRTGLADSTLSPIEAALRILAAELDGMTAMLETQADPAQVINKFRRVGAMIQSTPSLRAYQSDMLDQVISGWRGIVDCEVLAANPPHLLRFSWVGDENGTKTFVTYHLESIPSGTRLTYQHTGFTGLGGFLMAKLLSRVRTTMLTVGLPAVLNQTPSRGQPIAFPAG
jgi:AcrR family transcriptional regulator